MLQVKTGCELKLAAGSDNTDLVALSLFSTKECKSVVLAFCQKKLALKP